MTEDAWTYKLKDTLNDKNSYVRIIMHPAISGEVHTHLSNIIVKLLQNVY